MTRPKRSTHICKVATDLQEAAGALRVRAPDGVLVLAVLADQEAALAFIVGPLGVLAALALTVLAAEGGRSSQPRCRQDVHH